MAVLLLAQHSHVAEVKTNCATAITKTVIFCVTTVMQVVVNLNSMTVLSQ